MPSERGTVERNFAREWPAEALSRFKANVTIVEMLVELQAHTSQVITFPAPEAVAAGQVNMWDRVSRVLRGEDVKVSYPADQQMIVEAGQRLKTGVPAGLLQPLVVEIGNQRVDLGQVELWLDDPTVLEVIELDDGDFRHRVELPDRTLRYRRGSAS
jgi:hypothetical protein